MIPTNKKYDSATREKLLQVAPEDLKEALLRSLDYAHKKTLFISLLDCRIDSEELVQEAVARAYGVGTGKFDKLTYRNWDQSKYPLLEDFLKSIIKSLIDHILKENTGIVFLPTDSDDTFQSEKLEELIQHSKPSETAEAVLLKAEEAKELIKLLKKLSNDDEEIGMLLLAAEDGYSKAVEQAEATGYEIKKIYNIRKRLKRKLDPLLDKLNRKLCR